MNDLAGTRRKRLSDTQSSAMDFAELESPDLSWLKAAARPAVTREMRVRHYPQPSVAQGTPRSP